MVLVLLLILLDIVLCADLDIYDGGYLVNYTSPGEQIYSPLDGGDWAVGDNGWVQTNSGNGWFFQSQGSPLLRGLLPAVNLYGGPPRTPLLGGRFAVGSWGTVARDTGASWEKLWASSKSGNYSIAAPLPDYVLYSPQRENIGLLGGNFLFSRDGTILRDSGGGWEAFGTLHLKINDFVYVSSALGYLLSDNQVLAHNLQLGSWTLEDTSGLFYGNLTNGVSIGNNIWVVGLNATVLVKSTKWGVVPLNSTNTSSLDFYDVSGIVNQPLWIGASQGYLVSISTTGVLQKMVNLNTSDAVRVVKMFSSTFGIASTGSRIYHFNGNIWTQAYYNISVSINSIWISKATVAYAVGNNGTILKWNGISWSVMNSITKKALYSVHGYADSDVLAGGDGVSLYLDYTNTWKTMAIPSSYTTSSFIGTIDQGLCLAYGREDNTFDLSTNQTISSLSTLADNWHDGSFKFYCGTGSRRDISSYSYLQFQIRASGPDPQYPTIKLSSYFGSSNTLSIWNYTALPYISQTWTLVRIPMADLVTSWKINNLEYIIIGNNSKSCNRNPVNAYCRSIYLTDIRATNGPSDYAGSEAGVQLSPTNKLLRSIIKVDDNSWYACGDNGTVLVLQRSSKGWRVDYGGNVPWSLRGMYYRSAMNEVWAVGDGGVIMRKVLGGSWQIVNFNVPKRNYNGISGFGTLLWIVGDQGTILLYDGAQVVDQSRSGFVGNLRAVYASTRLVVTCGDFGQIYAYNISLSQWTKMVSPTTFNLTGVYMNSISSLWISGLNGTILSWDSSQSLWQIVQIGVKNHFYAIAGFYGDVVVSGERGITVELLWNGWQLTKTIPPGADGLDIYSMTGDTPCLFYSREVLWSDGDYAIEMFGDNWHSPSYKFYCGNGPRLSFCYYDTLQFLIRSNSKVLYPTLSLSSWNHASLVVPIVSYSNCSSGISTTNWCLVTIPLKNLVNPVDNWEFWNFEQFNIGNVSVGCSLTSPGSVLCDRLLVRDIQILNVNINPTDYICKASDALVQPAQLLPLSSPSNIQLNGITRSLRYPCSPARPKLMPFCPESAELWSCGNNGTIWKTDPQSLQWKAVLSGYTTANLYGITAVNRYNVIAVGEMGTLLQFNGLIWKNVDITSVTLKAVSAVDQGNIWAVGENGTIIYNNGQYWMTQNVPNNLQTTLNGVSGSPSDDFLGIPLFAVAVGDNGTILHYINNSWVYYPVNSSYHLKSVQVFSPKSAWAVGNDGIVIRWNGTSWYKMNSPSTNNLNYVDGVNENIQIVGEYGTSISLHWSGELRLQNTLNATNLRSIASWGTCIFFGKEAWGYGRGGVGSAILLTPDNWHVSSLNLYCGNKYRRDLSPYDGMEFWARTSTVGLKDVSFHLSKWDQQSQVVNLTDYVEGNRMDSTWRRVFIPFSALRTSEWSLGDTETLVFTGFGNGCDFTSRDSYNSCGHLFIDDIRVLDLTPPTIDSYWFESNTIIGLTLNEPYDLNSIKNPSFYLLQSNTDTNYISPRKPIEVSTFYKFTGFGNGSTSAVVTYKFYLEFENPLQNGLEYTLYVAGMMDESGNKMVPQNITFSWDDRKNPSRNIKVNTMGFLPNAPKQGYVSGYLGDKGGMSWVVGEAGTSWILQNGNWRFYNCATSVNMNSVSGITEKMAFAVGERGVISRWNGSAWNLEDSPTTETLNSVYIGIKGATVAVGNNGTILQKSNFSSPWLALNSPLQANFVAVWVGPFAVHDATQVSYILSDNGSIYSLTNGLLKELFRSNSKLNALHSTVQEILVVGDNGTLITNNPGWMKCTVLGELAQRNLTVVQRDAAGFEIWIGTDTGEIWKMSQFMKDTTCSFGAVLTGTLPGRVMGINTVSKHFCGYIPNRNNCTGTLGLAPTGVYSWPNFETFSSWAPYGLNSPTALRALSSVPFGPLRLPYPPPTANILQYPSNQTILQVPLQLRAFNWYLSGEDIYLFNFTQLQTPGTYFVHIPSIGISDPFVVDTAALDYAAYTTGRALYYQRCGLVSGHVTPYADARFARPPCHVSSDAAYHWSLPYTPLYNGENTSSVVTTDVHGGFHDAGDFNKYMASAAELIQYLMVGWDVDQGSFPDDVWNTPESGNGVPDLLDEAMYELDWLVRLQAADGGMYTKVSSCNFYYGMPETEKIRYIYEKTTADTAYFAAVAASVGRAVGPWDSTKSGVYIGRAEKAWEFLVNHPDALPVGGFANPPGCATGAYGDPLDLDNRVWAASELYRATGNVTYKSYYENTRVLPDVLIGGGGVTASRLGFADWAYMMNKDKNVNVGLQNSLRSHFVSAMRNIVTRTMGNPYLSGERLDVIDWIGWGDFTYGTRTALDLLRAWKVSGDPIFKTAASINIDTQLGAHPLAMSFITGIGTTFPKRPTCVLCQHDGIEDPIPGLPVFGSFHHLSNGHPYYSLVQNDASNYPYTYSSGDSYPSLRRYVDHPQVVPESEFSVTSIGHTLVTLNILATKISLPKWLIYQARISDDGLQLVLQLHRNFSNLLSFVGLESQCWRLFRGDTVGKLGDGAVCMVVRTDLIIVNLSSYSSLLVGDVVYGIAPVVGFTNNYVLDYSTSAVVKMPINPPVPVIQVINETMTEKMIHLTILLISNFAKRAPQCFYQFQTTGNQTSTNTITQLDNFTISIPESYSTMSFNIRVFCSNYLKINSEYHIVFSYEYLVDEDTYGGTAAPLWIIAPVLIGCLVIGVVVFVAVRRSQKETKPPPVMHTHSVVDMFGLAGKMMREGQDSEGEGKEQLETTRQEQLETTRQEQLETTRQDVQEDSS